MIIKEISIILDGDSIIFQANCGIRKGIDDKIYFKINKSYKEYLYADASPFAAALLIPAMKLGENLIIHGSISKKLYGNFGKIIEIMSTWNVGLKKIRVIPDNLSEDKQEVSNIGEFFSGGVDSFYTYL